MVVVVVESRGPEAALDSDGTGPEKPVVDGPVLHGVGQLHAGVVVHLLALARPVGAEDVVLRMDLGETASVALKLLLRGRLGRRI